MATAKKARQTTLKKSKKGTALRPRQVTFRPSQTGLVRTQTVTLQIQDWSTDADPLDYVLFRNIGNLTITVLLPGGLFSGSSTITLAPGIGQRRRVMNTVASGPYKYAVHTFLNGGDSFIFDPRFIIS